MPNDIDIAIKVSEDEREAAFTYSIAEGRAMETELSELLNYKVHLL